MERDEIYEESEKLYKALSLVPSEKCKEICELLGYTYSTELFDDLTLALLALADLLKTYRELKEVSK